MSMSMMVQKLMHLKRLLELKL
ncbi:hypothetical protein F8388_017780 [Cannabis sativa]|uniref:Uncharacterized protein n=1 Tax=Cannabis sativa TaxID=3483 RepID=A0A7J6E587_CANSA|nr:hypothetical protein F8388_017780 [Cannabis sativa]